MTQESGEVVVRDLGSTNGIRINGQRVEIGRLRPGDELSIAHDRYRLEKGDRGESRGLGVELATGQSRRRAVIVSGRGARPGVLRHRRVVAAVDEAHR
jgi:pSer/pThr/pTyr-binding forkhead associated (FHA) protein